MRPPDRYIISVLFGLFETANIMNSQKRPKTIEEYEIARQTHYTIMNILIKAGARPLGSGRS